MSRSTRSSQLDLLRKALQQNVHFGRFELTSGETTDYYIDVRPVLLHSCTSRAVAMELLQRISLSVGVVAGVGVSGSLMVASLLAHTVKDMKGLIVRKEAKKHGLTRVVEGDDLIRNCDVVLVDDILNTGSSFTFATRALRDLRNCKVVQWLIFIDRSVGPIEGAPEIASILKASEIMEDINNGKQKQTKEKGQGKKEKGQAEEK